MNAAEAMDRIEGHTFSAMVNLASDLRTFLRILASQPEVQALAAGVESDRVMLDVFTRVVELAASPAEEGCEHPADSALAAYLWLLSAKDPEYSDIVAEAILGCGRCWWAWTM